MACLVSLCDRPIKRRGYCNSHYQRLMKYGDPLAGGVFRDPDRQTKPCEIDGCDERRHARRMCDGHYTRWLRYGDPLAAPPQHEASPCSIIGCERPAVGRTWCPSHYSKWKRHGDPTWKSTPQTRRRGEATKRDGYRYLYLPEHPNARKDGKIAEHTVVMSEVLARPLSGDENVHHKNGIRDDNRPDNLELWASAQPSGQRVRDLVEFANWIIERYGTDPAAYP